MSKRARRGGDDDHEEGGHERWLVTYADMVTLLMVLFIVMFAMSTVEEKKFNALRSGLAAGFGQSTSILDGSDSLLEQPGVAPIEPIVPDDHLSQMPEVDQVAVSDAVKKDDQQSEQRKYAEAEAEVDRLVEILDRIKAALAAEGLGDDIRAVIDERGLVVSLVSRHVIFEANLAELSARGKLVLRTMAPVLRDLSDQLEIDGHTNQVPVKPKYYPTDWELSAARAVNVLRRLHEVEGIPNERMMATAFGQERPLVDPKQPGSQRINKRVDIVVVSGLPAESRELLEDVALRRGGNS